MTSRSSTATAVSMLTIVARAEARVRQTGKPTCAICLGMTVVSPDEARCMRRAEQFVLDGTTSLSGMTRRAQECDRFDSMLEEAPCES